MENPVIIQFDEDESYMTVVSIIGFNMGFTLTATGKNIEETRNIISRIEKKQLKPNIAIIADYLGNDFNDGMKLAKKLKEIAPDLKIIAYVTDAEVAWGDYLALKSSEDQNHSLIKILEDLTKKTFKASNLA